jgi:hypothetical protein
MRGSLAKFVAMRRASSFVRRLFTVRAVRLLIEVEIAQRLLGSVADHEAFGVLLD